MTWFQNLRTMTKLLVGFGLLAALMGVVGYQGTSGMAQIDGMLGTMYQRDMMGLSAIKDVATDMAMIGRHTRGAVLASDAAGHEREHDKVEALTTQMGEPMRRLDQTFVTEKGKALVAELKQVVPEYVGICRETIRVASTQDQKSALTVLSRAVALGDRVNALVKAMVEMKETFALQAFEDSHRLYASARTTMLTIMFGSIVLALLLGLGIAKMISNPLERTVVMLQGVAAGDLTHSLDVNTKDEVGQMAGALNEAVDSMRTALEEVRSSSDSLAAMSQELAASSEELSSGAQEQASGIEETSASLEQITASVKQNADSARQANQLAEAAREAAERGGQVVNGAVAAMGEINASSKRIADIISAIDEIAFQTNLLALNAAVEAARAGEQGRGFAVVAAEVRSLAQRSATAAKEIKGLIQDSVRKVDAGSEMVNQSGHVLVEIVASVKRVTDIVGEIAAASREQSTGVDQVASAMSQMDTVTQQNSAQTEELSATAETLSSSAEQLLALVSRFKLDNGRGVAGPRKASKARPAVTRGQHSNGLRSLQRNVSAPSLDSEEAWERMPGARTPSTPLSEV